MVFSLCRTLPPQPPPKQAGKSKQIKKAAHYGVKLSNMNRRIG
jgi:hypothetical protein